MEKKKVIIIGAGISGLSAGTYLQMNGYDTEIYEQGIMPGGLCTGWKRKDYHFDGCLHWLVGTKPSVSIYDIWNELIDMKKLNIVDYNEYCAIEDEQGGQFVAYSDIIKLEQEMERVSPEDDKVIHEFINGIKKFLNYNLPVEKPIEFMSIHEKINMLLSMLPKMFSIMKWSRISNKEYAKRFKNPLLKRFFTIAYPADYSVLITMINCGWIHKKGVGYPIGGSNQLSELMVTKYLESGGKLNYQSMVDKIMIKNESACGVQLRDKKEIYSDIVVSAADGYHTIYKMLEGKYKDKRIIKIYENHKLQTQSGMMFATIGVSRTFTNEPHWIFIPLKKRLHIDNQTILNELAVTINNFDYTSAPEGKSCITLMLSSNNYEYWYQLRRKNNTKYKEEKERILNEILDALELRFGNIKDTVEVCELATPATYIKYFNLWKASIGWCASKNTFFQSVPKELKGLKNFYMTGQWVEIGGGVPMCMFSGRNTAQRICKKDSRKFKTWME